MCTGLNFTFGQKGFNNGFTNTIYAFYTQKEGYRQTCLFCESEILGLYLKRKEKDPPVTTPPSPSLDTADMNTREIIKIVFSLQQGQHCYPHTPVYPPVTPPCKQSTVPSSADSGLLNAHISALWAALL